jgi:hypothetical protein
MRTTLLRTALTAAAAISALLLSTTAAQASDLKENDPVQSSAPGHATILVTKLTHAEAAARFRAAGITWSSSGNCSDRYNSTCTSFEQINLATVQGAETLKKACGCALNITGGTEVGHASGTYSHWNGYKLDYSPYTGITNYVHSHFTYIGGNQWRSGSGNIYYFETNHWDVTYYNCGGC